MLFEPVHVIAIEYLGRWEPTITIFGWARDRVQDFIDVLAEKHPTRRFGLMIRGQWDGSVPMVTYARGKDMAGAIHKWNQRPAELAGRDSWSIDNTDIRSGQDWRTR